MGYNEVAADETSGRLWEGIMATGDHDTNQQDARRPAADARPQFSPDGVDLTLIRWMLSLTPDERLAALQSSVQSLVRLRDARSRS